jgi:hypothetical protein
MIYHETCIGKRATGNQARERERVSLLLPSTQGLDSLSVGMPEQQKSPPQEHFYEKHSEET